MPDFAPELERYTSFAGQFRYEEPPHLPEAERAQVRQWITALRIYCLQRICQLMPSALQG